MTEQPNTGAGLRGAVDLSGLQGAGGAGAGAGMPGGAGGVSAAAGAGGVGGAGGATGVPGRSGVVVEGTDANFQEIANASLKVPLVAVLWAAQLPESRDYLDTVVKVAAGSEGRFQVVSINVEANPGLMRAFQVQSVPVTIGLVQGQPVPMFAGVQPEQTVKQVLDEFLSIAVQQGVVDRVQLGAGDGSGDEEDKPLPPLHQEAFDAIENGDLDAARAYKTALKQDPNDADAEIGLAQVGLMQRTQGVDLQAAREKAAAAPLDVDAQVMVADLDLLGGHVEDAFTRLIDLVRATGGEERERARAHLLELFAVVGNADERVRKGRTALMSALF
jgi:putative thioredoxin